MLRDTLYCCLGSIDSRYLGCYHFGGHGTPLHSAKGSLSESVEWCIYVCHRWKYTYTGKRVRLQYSQSHNYNDVTSQSLLVPLLIELLMFKCALNANSQYVI